MLRDFMQFEFMIYCAGAESSLMRRIICCEKINLHNVTLFFYVDSSSLLNLRKCIFMDKLSPEARGRLMARIKSKDTKPELAVRKLVFAMGFRYRLHSRKLPGNPDLVFPRRKKVIFVNGCFWHHHSGCRLASTPTSHEDYWLPKFARTVERDQQSILDLAKLGWSSLTVWECELKDVDTLSQKVKTFLDA